MDEIEFGENKVLYGVTVNPDGRIRVNVYHNNKDWRHRIRTNKANPQFFLRLLDLSGTNPRAKYWLAKIVKTYTGRFTSGRVDFFLK